MIEEEAEVFVMNMITLFSDLFPQYAPFEEKTVSEICTTSERLLNENNYHPYLKKSFRIYVYYFYEKLKGSKCIEREKYLHLIKELKNKL